MCLLCFCPTARDSGHPPRCAYEFALAVKFDGGPWARVGTGPRRGLGVSH